MAKISAKQAGSKNAVAFLDMIAFAEGTSTSRYTKNDGYDVIVGGVDSPNIFSDYSKHPGVLVLVRPEVKSPATGRVTRKALKSTAAGRYQEKKSNWEHYKVVLKLEDYSPISQDLIALRHIKECRALDDVHAGRFADAVAKVANIWASLPGNNYGQRSEAHSPELDELLAVYKKAGGELA